MIKKILKIGLISLISFIFIACENNNQSTKKKEVKYTASLPMPEWDENGGKKIWDAYKNWHRAKKDPIPATQIGYAYSEKLKDYDKAISWYKYSNSMKPMPKNSNYMCYAYQMKKEYEEAIKWCKNAIELGSDEALFQVGKIYEDLENYTESIKWYEQSASKNNISAMNNLGFLYNEKVIDLKKSESWYKKAIKKKNKIAFHNIAHLYHLDLKDDIKASAYAIALIGNKYSKSSVLNILQREWKIPNETIKKGYELQLNSDEFSIKFKGELNLE